MKRLKSFLLNRWVTSPLFVLYLAAVLRLAVFRDTFFPIRLMQGAFDEPWRYYRFWIAHRNWHMLWKDFSWNYIGNVAAFVPLGVYVALYACKSPVQSAFYSGLVLSLLIEASQFVFSVGAVSVSDVVTNTLGAVLGGWLVWRMRKK